MTIKKMIQRNKYTNFFGYLYFIWGLIILFQQTVNFNFPVENMVVKIINVTVLIALVILEFLILRKSDFKVNVINLCLIILFVLMGTLAAYHQYGLNFIVAFLFIIVSGNFEINDILRPFLWFSGLILVGTIILNRIGKIPDFYLLGNVRARASLGFSYYSFSAQIAFYFIVAFLVYKDKKITYFEIVLLAILNRYIYYYTNTRSPYLLTLLVLIYCVLKKIFHFSGIVNTILGKYVIDFAFPLSFIGLYWLTFKSPATIFTKFNTALSGRLNLNVLAFQNWGVHIFGQKIEFSTVDVFGKTANNYNYVDSSYFQNLIVNGWLFTIIIITAFMFLCMKAVKEKNDMLAVALTIIAIHAMFDPQLIWPWFSPFSLLIGKLFPLDGKVELDKKNVKNNTF